MVENEKDKEMRRGIVVLSMLGSLLSGCSSTGATVEGVPYEDLVQRDNVVYHNEAPYSGMFFDKNRYEVLRAKGYLENGLLQGELFHYDNDGKIMKRFHYKEGKEDGISTTYYDDGAIETLSYFESGEGQGRWLRYYPSGAIERISYLKNDRPEGEWTYFNEDGSVKEKRIYRNGQWVD